jgi:hypothetical protein
LQTPQGFVYKVDGSDENLVMKVEKKSSRSRLPNEYIAYSRLKGVSGIPSVKAFQESTKTHVMVMDHAGVSLHEMFQRRDMLPQGSIQHLVAYFGYQMVRTTFPA